MSDKIRVYMGIPSTGTRSDSQMYNLRLIEEKYGDRIEFVYPKQLTKRIFHDFARNCIVEEFLESKCDILWFLDSDIVPPVHVMDLITKHGHMWSAAGAAYPVQMMVENEPSIVFTGYRMKEGRLQATGVYRQGLEFVDGLATGCLFIRRGVFDLLDKPYFEFKYRREDMFMVEGEDLGFCRKLHELGIRFLTDWSMVCRHYKTIDLLDMNNYAVEFANKKLKAYDAQVKPQVIKLQKELNNLRGKVTPQQPSRSKLILPGHLSK